MKILRFLTTGNRPLHGVWEEDQVRVIAGDPFGIWGLSETRIPLERVTLILPPVDPPNIASVGINFEKTALALGQPVPEHPSFVWQATTSLTGRDRPLIIPHGKKGMATFHAQLAIAVRSQLFQANEEEAKGALFGYTGAIGLRFPEDPMDVGPGWVRGRSYDSTTSIGPFLQTEMDPDEATVRCRLNGVEVASTEDSPLLFPCAKILSDLSHRHTLRPGTLILTGPIPLLNREDSSPASAAVKEGDVLEVETVGAGKLSNPVVASE